MAAWFSKLEKSFAAHEADPRTVKAGHGRLLFSRHAARIVAVEMPGVEGNLFYHHPDHEKPDAPLTGLGGDRLWIAPEAGLIYIDRIKAQKDVIKYAKLPPCMDPGDWRIVEDMCGHFSLVTEMKLLDHRIKKKIALRAQRAFTVIDAPEGLPKSIKSASFAIRNELTLLEAQKGTVAGAWDLLQMPPTGWLICPTVTPVKSPRSYYKPFGAKHVKCGKDAVRFLIDAQRQIKMGLSPTQTTGRMGYYRTVGKTATLIVRIFAPQPGNPYVDIPLTSSAFFGGDALQAYNDDLTFGSFGEMEYHEPALVAGENPTTRVGSSVTHILAGPPTDVKKAGEMLLGVKI